ncbi:muscle M-line assembly protein unc-89-like, partial [Mercenaria mercenaria]|uniref:muscle M-line assembly protein unc-89-like n=1 Tax=Mercenaria mercenaria TaxID=6596 RepID=UPI00234F8876
PTESVTIDVPRGDILHVKENTTFTFTCISSYSRPASNVTWWLEHGVAEEKMNISEGIQVSHKKDINGLTSTKSELDLTTNRSLNGWKVYCASTNIKGYVVSSDAILLNVSYPPNTHPEIMGFKNGSMYNVIENSTGRLSCSISGGNPAATLTWNCYNEGVSVINGSTVVRTLTWVAARGQDRVCICRAVHDTWHVTEIVNVEILYKAIVQKFFIEGHDGQRIVTVNENETLRFICGIDSNPVSTVKLYFQGKAVIYKEYNSKTLTFTRENVSCLDAGVYTCTASNEYNHGLLSMDIISVLVRCPPRIHPEADAVSIIAAAQGSPVIFSIATLAYPEPGPSGFFWKKQNGSYWTTLTQTERIKISSTELVSNLTISNVITSDYGSYKLVIRNVVGKLDRMIKLVEDNHPDIDRNTVPVIAIVFGCLVPLLAISAVLVIVVIRFRRKQHNNRNEDTEMTITSRAYDGLNTEKQTTESNEKAYEEVRQDRGNSQCPVYTNLAL